MADGFDTLEDDLLDQFNLACERTRVCQGPESRIAAQAAAGAIAQALVAFYREQRERAGSENQFGKGLTGGKP